MQVFFPSKEYEVLVTALFHYYRYEADSDQQETLRKIILRIDACHERQDNKNTACHKDKR